MRPKPPPPPPLNKFPHVVDDKGREIQQHARRSYLLDGLECFVFGCLELRFRWRCLGATEHLDLVFLLSSVNVVGRGELLVAPD